MTQSLNKQRSLAFSFLLSGLWGIQTASATY